MSPIGHVLDLMASPVERCQAMNRIVVRQVPAGALPVDLRDGIDPSHRVEVTVRELAPQEAEDGAAGHFSRFFGQRRANFADVDGILAHVRAVRDGEG